MGYGSGFAEEMLRPVRLPPKPAPTPSLQWLKRHPEQAAALGYELAEPAQELAGEPRMQALPSRGSLREELPRYTPEERCP